jgi:hypothetical protein
LLRSTFGRVVVWLGVVTGVSGVLAVLGAFIYEPLGTVAILTAVLTLLWFLLMGLRLLRLTQMSPARLPCGP